MSDSKPEQPIKPIKVITGSIVVSDQMLAAMRESERAWLELGWIAGHYEQATPEQRERWDRFSEAVDRYEDEW